MDTELNSFNVLPHLKRLSVEEIRQSVKRFPFSVAAYNVHYGSNMGTILRACNVFAATNFIHVGANKWDRRGSLGVQNYENILHFETWEESLKWMRSQNYSPIGVDWTANSTPIHEIEKYEGHPVFIMGNERSGLPECVLKECSKVIHIEQFGTIPSLNVSQAAAIICNDWHTKRRQNV